MFSAFFVYKVEKIHQTYTNIHQENTGKTPITHIKHTNIMNFINISFTRSARFARYARPPQASSHPHPRQGSIRRISLGAYARHQVTASPTTAPKFLCFRTKNTGGTPFPPFPPSSFPPRNPLFLFLRAGSPISPPRRNNDDLRSKGGGYGGKESPCQLSAAEVKIFCLLRPPVCPHQA